MLELYMAVQIWLTFERPVAAFAFNSDVAYNTLFVYSLRDNDCFAVQRFSVFLKII